MSNAIIAQRYARALLEIARECQAAARFQDELGRFAQAATLQPDLLLVLGEEHFPVVQRHAVVQALAAPLALDPLVVNFLKLLIDRRRIDIFPDVVTAYESLAAESAGVVTAQVTTAVPVVDVDILHSIEQAVATLKHKQVRTVTQVNPALIGGVMVRVGDEIFDGSIAAELRRMKTMLLEAV